MKKISNDEHLTLKQKRFVQEYLIDLNATQAAIRAGYSKKTANQQGPRLLVNVGIQERIQELIKERSKRTKLTQDMVVKELAKTGFSNMRDYANWNGKEVNLIDSHELTEDQAAVVSEVAKKTAKDGSSIKFKLHDKIKALELLGKHLGMFKETFDVNLGNCGAVRLGDGDAPVIQFPKKKPVGAPVTEIPKEDS